jgi:DNA-binding transcriptional regulator YhcF (GntR family)
MSDTDTKAVLRKLLQDHVGESNAITQSQLAGATGVNPSTLRSELRRLREERHIPIANQREGYYVIGDREELQDYIGHINREIESKRQTIKHTLAAFEEFDRDDELDAEDGDGCERCGARIDGDPYKWFSVDLCQQCYQDKPPSSDDFDEWVLEGSA